MRFLADRFETSYCDFDHFNLRASRCSWSLYVTHSENAVSTPQGGPIPCFSVPLLGAQAQGILSAASRDLNG